MEPALGEPRLDDAAKSKLRKQALDWLKAELSAWKRVSMTVEPGNKGLVAKTLSQWKQDADLAGIRDAKDLAKLPDEERAAFKKLWDAVEALMTKVQDGKTSAFQVGAAAIELACTSLKRQQRSDSD